MASNSQTTPEWEFRGSCSVPEKECDPLSKTTLDEVVSCRLEPQDTWQVCTKKLLAAINAIHERLDEMDERWSRRHEP